jgi:mono/diheme cytochrome c family protein
MEANVFPFPVGANDLARGRERYEIYCSPCHGFSGEGNGMIVQRGLSPPPSYHIERLRQAPAGHFVAIMTNGFGKMFSYSARVSPEDRWRVAAYIRALQLAQSAPVTQLSSAERQKLQSP